MKLNVILYVANQSCSTEFYRAVLQRDPTLNVPGMTEFELGVGVVLGLMPETGIKCLLGDAIPNPSLAAGVPRCELYLSVEDPEAAHGRALLHGARELSPYLLRNWGDWAAYSMDPDGHIIAFASLRPKTS